MRKPLPLTLAIVAFALGFIFAAYASSIAIKIALGY